MSVNKIGVAAWGVDAADDVCGGVVDPPFCMGDVLPLTVRCNVKLVYCVFGEIGDRGATARTLFGESGVRPAQSPKKYKRQNNNKKLKINKYTIHNFTFHNLHGILL